MKLLRYNDPGFSKRVEALAAASSLFDPAIEESASAILRAVQERGDNALLEFTARFDGATLTADQLPVSKAELLGASLAASDELRETLSLSTRNIEKFSSHALRKPWSTKNHQGARVGEKFDPFQRVGIYIPGGTAPLVSTALMTVVLARVAGCREIVVCTPCGKNGAINPALLLALSIAGATEIYRAGGAQAIAAMAFGTNTIRKVQKIFGPGNAYVVAAKRLLFGHVAVDLLPGPSEVLILADETANPKFVAADMLAQAEHGSGEERVWLVTSSKRLVTATQKELDRQLPKLARKNFIKKALDKHGAMVLVKDLSAAVPIVNRLAPEHCEIMTRNPASLVSQIKTAGAIFVGPWSPTVAGDYVAGPSHTLPTGGGGLSFAGLTVDQFQRRTSVVEYSKPALKKSLKAIAHFASVEGLGAHGRSASIRFGK